MHKKPLAAAAIHSPIMSDFSFSSISGTLFLMDHEGRRKAVLLMCIMGHTLTCLTGKEPSRSPSPIDSSPHSRCSKDSQTPSVDELSNAPTVHHVKTETPRGLRKPATMLPVTIPGSQSVSNVGTPRNSSHDFMDKTTRDTNTDQKLPEHTEKIPSMAWMSGADAVDGQLECQLSWLDLVEQSLEELYGQRWIDRVHPGDAQQCRTQI